MKTFHGMIGHGKTEDRQANDYYPTPPYVTFALTKHVDVKGREVLEPAAGRGWMAQELERCGARVTAADLHDYATPEVDNLVAVIPNVNFLEDWIDLSEFDAVITNPPYGRGMAEAFVRKALDLNAPVVAVLARLAFMESQGRLELFQEHPPALILPFSKRFSCTEDRFESEPFGGMVAYAWYVWRRGEINTQVKWIDSQAVYDEWRAARGI